MKGNNYRNAFAALTALLLFGACSNDSDEPQEQPMPITLTCSLYGVTGVETRAASDLHNSIEGENVNVYMPGSTATTSATVYRVGTEVDADGWLKMNTSDAVYLFSDQTDVYGLYPTAVKMTDGKVSYPVPTDQSDEAYYQLADLLYAKSKILKSSAQGSGNIPTTQLTFHHLMSKVIVNVAPVTADIMDVTGIWVANVNKTIELTPSTYEARHDTNDGITTKDNVGDEGIKAGTVSGTCALVPPQTVSAGTGFIIVEAKSKNERHTGTVTYKLDKALTLYPGKTYTITLSLEKVDFGSVMNITVSDWGSTEEIDNNLRLAV